MQILVAKYNISANFPAGKIFCCKIQRFKSFVAKYSASNLLLHHTICTVAKYNNFSVMYCRRLLLCKLYLLSPGVNNVNVRRPSTSVFSCSFHCHLLPRAMGHGMPICARAAAEGPAEVLQTWLQRTAGTPLLEYFSRPKSNCWALTAFAGRLVPRPRHFVERQRTSITP